MGSSAGPGALAPDGSQVWSVLDESSTASRRIFEDQPGFSIAATDPVPCRTGAFSISGAGFASIARATRWRAANERIERVFLTIVAISVGAALGALLRWVLGIQLNSLFSSIPPGTLVANLVGGYLIGVAVAFFANHPALPPQWRLFVITGFLGGLTTFSTFSAEVVSNLMEGRVMWAVSTIAVHVLGSVGMTILGIGTFSLVRSLPVSGG
jgi:fluoride exporter